MVKLVSGLSDVVCIPYRDRGLSYAQNRLGLWHLQTAVRVYNNLSPLAREQTVKKLFAKAKACLVGSA